MRLIELHILQSFPVSCLNRAEVGSPKTAIFGAIGVWSSLFTLFGDRLHRPAKAPVSPATGTKPLDRHGDGNSPRKCVRSTSSRKSRPRTLPRPIT